MKKAFIIFFIFIVTGFVVFGLNSFFSQKKENTALRIKIISMKKEKNIPKSWARLTQESIQRFSPIKPQNEKSLDDLIPMSPSIEQLAKNLSQKMYNIKKLDVTDIEKCIELAETIIAEEPASLSAYKAKLISMLVLESKFDQKIDDYEISKILETLASFEVESDSVAKREAALIGRGNAQLSILENQLNEISFLRDEIVFQTQGLDQSSPYYEELINEDNELALRENLVALNLENAQNNLSNEIAYPVQPSDELIEIPFLRLMAKEEYDTVIEDAESYISEFPNSPNIYFFLIRALEFQGRDEEALRIIEESNLSSEAQSILQARLISTSNEDPKKYWENLKF